MANGRLNSIVDDIAAEIGYTAASALVDWFGGGYLYVPKEADNTHPISLVIGDLAMRRLIKGFAGESLAIPYDFHRERDRRDRLITVLAESGYSSRQIATVAGMTSRQVENVRKRVVQLGLVPLILKRAGISTEKPKGNAGGKFEEKAEGKSRGKFQPIAGVVQVKRKAR